MKIKSSALLITLALGIVLSGIIIGVAAVYSQYVKSSAQAREGKKAYRAALSGVDDGLLRYKYYLAGIQDPSYLYGINDKVILDSVSEISYKLSFKMDSITFGDSVFPIGFKIGTTSLPADVTSRQRAIRQNVDDVIDIDLSYLAHLPAGKRLEKLKIHFTPPCNPTNCTAATYQPLSGYFTAMNYRLVDVKAINEDQLISEATNEVSSASNIEVEVNSIIECQKPSRNCHLRITPRAAKLSLLDPGGRFGGKDAAAQGKRVFLDIEARTKVGAEYPLIPSTGKKPGTISVISVGMARGAERKIEARIDPTSGRYVGLFDYGIYCGAECIGI